MNEIVNAEYRVVQERTLPVIASEILQIERNVYAVAMDGAIQIGRKLQEAKDMVEYGQWESWCRDNLNYSHSQATRFMKIATEFGDKNTPYSKIATSQEVSISKALELLKVPEEQVETFVEEHDIEEISVRELREEIGYDAAVDEMEQVACLRRTNSFCGVYSLRIDWPAERFVLQREEVSAVQWCDSARLMRMVAEGMLYNYGDAYFRMLFEYGRRAQDGDRPKRFED